MSATSVLRFDIENKQKDFQVIANRLDNGEDIIGWVVVEQPWYSPKNRWKYYVFYNEYGSGGMCGYDFNQFFNEKDIDCENDMRVQEMFLEKINMLIDCGIIALEGKS